MPKFTLHKLVRDKILQDYLDKDQHPVYKQLGKSDHIQALIQKLREEADELARSPAEGVASELADIQQVLDDLASLYKVDLNEVAAIKEQKKLKKGGFEQGYFVESLELDEDDEWTAYYRREPDVFPES